MTTESDSVAESLSALAALRKNTIAEVGVAESTPVTTVALPLVTAANPELLASDHRLRDAPMTEPIESIHGCVALIVSAIPSVGVRGEEIRVAL